MEPIAIEINGAVVGYVCGKCHHPGWPFVKPWDTEEGTKWALNNSKHEARTHCEPECNDCHEPFGDKQQWVGGICEGCSRARRAKQMQADYDAAKKIPEAEYHGYLVVGERDAYHETIDDLIEWCVDSNTEFPQWAWAVIETAFSIDADDIIDKELGNHHDEAAVGDADRAELREYLVRWCKRTGITTLWPDYRRVILLEPRKIRGEEDDE